MSVHYVYKRDGGAKFMRPIHTREEYLSLRNGGEQIPLMKRIRAGEEQLKTELVQMNYSCLPNEDGSLKGSKTMSTTVGMDIDHIPKDEMQTVRGLADVGRECPWWWLSLGIQASSGSLARG